MRNKTQAAYVACLMTVTILLVAVPGSMAQVAVTPVFRCNVEQVRKLLSTTPLTTKPQTGPASVYTAFEFDTASGLLRWRMTDGTLDRPDQYEIVQKGSDSNDWVAVFKFAFLGNTPESKLASAVISFIRIRPWKLSSEAERGRFFMIQNMDDLVIGRCAPR